MTIGIDLDDTICRTTEIIHKKIDEYSEKIKLNSLDIMNDEVLKEEFLEQNLTDAYQKVEIKREVKEVIRRLRNKGNKIIIITSRDNKYYEITKNWLSQEKIVIDGLILQVDGEIKAQTCKDQNVDLMIEDNPYNYKKMKEHGINCILFDDRGKYDLKQDYFTNWKEIEKYIERNH